MKIYKDTYPGFDTKAKIESEIKKAEDQISVRNNGTNNPFTAKSWAFQIAKGEPWEYIGKTKEVSEKEVEEKSKLEAEEKAVSNKLELYKKAKIDPVLKDQLITQEMNESGFDSGTIAIILLQERRGEINASEFINKSAEKILEIRTQIDES